MQTARSSTWSRAASPLGSRLQDEPGGPGSASRVAAEAAQAQRLRVEIGHRNHRHYGRGRPAEVPQNPVAGLLSGRPAPPGAGPGRGERGIVPLPGAMAARRGGMSGWKIRLGDGSEIGPMDLAALRTWLAQGLVDGDSPVMRPGSRKWVPLGTVPELKGALGASRPRRPEGKRARAGPRVRRGPGGRRSRPPLDHWRVRVVGVLLLAAGGGLRLPRLAPGRGAPGLRRRALVAAGARRARARARAPAGLGSRAPRSCASSSSSRPSRSSRSPAS